MPHRASPKLYMFIITCQLVSFHCYAYDTQLYSYSSFKVDEAHQVVKLETCPNEGKTCMTSTFLDAQCQ